MASQNNPTPAGDVLQLGAKDRREGWPAPPVLQGGNRRDDCNQIAHVIGRQKQIS